MMAVKRDISKEGEPNESVYLVTEYFAFVNYTRRTFKIELGKRTTLELFDKEKKRHPKFKLEGLVVPPEDTTIRSLDFNSSRPCWVHLFFKFDDGSKDEFYFKLTGGKGKLVRREPVDMPIEWLKNCHDIFIEQEDIGDKKTGKITIAQYVLFHVDYTKEQKLCQMANNFLKKADNADSYEEAIVLTNIATFLTKNENFKDQAKEKKAEYLQKSADNYYKDQNYIMASGLLKYALKLVKPDDFGKTIVIQNKIDNIDAIMMAKKAQARTECDSYNEAKEFINKALFTTVSPKLFNQFTLEKSKILNKWGEHLMNLGVSVQNRDSVTYFNQAKYQFETADSVQSSSKYKTNLQLAETKIKEYETYKDIKEKMPPLMGKFMASLQKKNQSGVTSAKNDLKKIFDQLEKLETDLKSASKLNEALFHYSLQHLERLLKASKQFMESSDVFKNVNQTIIHVHLVHVMIYKM